MRLHDGLTRAAVPHGIAGRRSPRRRTCTTSRANAAGCQPHRACSDRAPRTAETNTSGERRTACDRRVRADQADSDAPLTALCPVPMPRCSNFSFSGSGTEPRSPNERGRRSSSVDPCRRAAVAVAAHTFGSRCLSARGGGYVVVEPCRVGGAGEGLTSHRLVAGATRPSIRSPRK